MSDFSCLLTVWEVMHACITTVVFVIRVSISITNLWGPSILYWVRKFHTSFPWDWLVVTVIGRRVLYLGRLLKHDRLSFILVGLDRGVLLFTLSQAAEDYFFHFCGLGSPQVYFIRTGWSIFCLNVSHYKLVYKTSYNIELICMRLVVHFKTI